MQITVVTKHYAFIIYVSHKYKGWVSRPKVKCTENVKKVQKKGWGDQC